MADLLQDGWKNRRKNARKKFFLPIFVACVCPEYRHEKCFVRKKECVKRKR